MSLSQKILLLATDTKRSCEHRLRSKINNTMGSTLIEFSIAAVMLLVTILGVIEMSRLVLVYTSVSNAARAGARYAIVHGSDRTGSGYNGPSSSSDYSQVQVAVQNFASAGTLNPSGITTTVTYLDGNSNGPGNRVQVQVVYTYDPLMGFFNSALSIPLSSISYGVITY